MLPAAVDRRIRPRIVIECPALFAFEATPAVQGVAVDISSTGVGVNGHGEVARMLLYRARSADVSERRCVLSVVLPESFERSGLEMVARLAWAARAPQGGVAAGFEFLSLAPEDCKYVERIVEEAIEDVRAAVMQLIN